MVQRSREGAQVLTSAQVWTYTKDGCLGGPLGLMGEAGGQTRMRTTTDSVL